nr:hypothetical protein [Tanacetum cinerariifolium]
MSWFSRCSWCGCSFNGGNCRHCTNDPEDSLIIRNEELSTILEKESEEFINSSVEDFVLIPNEVLEEIKSKASYDSNLDKPTLLVMPFFYSNEDDCFDPGGDVDEINAFDIPSNFEDGYYDSEGDVLYLESLLSDDTTPNLPPEMFLDRDPRNLNERIFKSLLSRNIPNLERKLNKETLHEKDSNSDLRVIKVPFDQFIHSKVLEPSNYNSYDLETRQDFKAYTNMEAQTFKDVIIQSMDSIEQCIIERARHKQELHNSGIVSDKGNDQSLENHNNTSGNEKNMSRNECNDKITFGDDTDVRPSYDTEPMAEVRYTAEYNVFAIESQHSKQPKYINDTRVMEKDESNVIPYLSNMCDNDNQTDQNAKACEDERVALANLIANLKLNIDENKQIQMQLEKSNESLTHELKEYKSTLKETNRTLGESNRTRDRYLVTLHDKEVELAKYKTFKDRTIKNDTLKRKLKETQAVLAQKEHDLKEGLKLKAYEISVVKEKHDELVKHSLLTKSRYEVL